jgi:protein-L-isoaspartate(D-aspartate) O-methyltransferase
MHQHYLPPPSPFSTRLPSHVAMRLYPRSCFVMMISMHEQRKAELVRSLQDSGILHDGRIERAFLMVPLEEFIPEHLQVDKILYADTPQVFYFKNHADRRTISAPHMITIMLEYLNLRPTDQLLILGSKSGYLEAIASLLCTEGNVYVVDSSEEIVEYTRSCLKNTGFGENVMLIHGNPLTMAGTESLGKWDKILIPYQVQEPDIYPALRQLAENGVLFAPVGDDSMQYFTQVIKHDGKYYGNRISTVVFSPLDKNVTFFSQQLQFLELVKLLEQQPDVNPDLKPFSEQLRRLRATQQPAIPVDIEAAIRHTKEAILARHEQATKDPVTIIYDSETGDQLHEEYRQETMVSTSEESWDFKVVESAAVELALKYRGTVRIVTIMNALNALPFEMVKLYLKKSTRGKLAGDVNDPKALKFVLEDALVENDPVTANILDDLSLQVMTLYGLIKESTIGEFKDVLRYFTDKLDFLSREKGVSFKNTALAITRMNQQASMLQTAIIAEGLDCHAGQVAQGSQARRGRSAPGAAKTLTIKCFMIRYRVDRDIQGHAWPIHRANILD